VWTYEIDYTYTDTSWNETTVTRTIIVEDIDECALWADTCDSNATCTNTLWSFGCTCVSWYVWDWFICNRDTDWDWNPNITDPDDDWDWFDDINDDFPLDSSEWIDTDWDWIWNNADWDDDWDNVDDSVEDSGPNWWDWNDDWVIDSLQWNVATIPTLRTWSHYTLEIPWWWVCNTIDTFVATLEEDQSVTDPDLYYPLWLNEFVIPCAWTVDITLYYHDTVSLSSYTYMKYWPLIPWNLTSYEWYVLNDVTPISIDSAVVGTNTVWRVTFTLGDWQPWDDTWVDWFIIDANWPWLRQPWTGISSSVNPEEFIIPEDEHYWAPEDEDENILIDEIPFTKEEEHIEIIIKEKKNEDDPEVLDNSDKKENRENNEWEFVNDLPRNKEWLGVLPLFLPKTWSDL